jgi:two-component system, sensor histidine kinase
MTSKRLHDEQIKLLFDFVTPAVVSAAFFAVIFVISVHQLGYLNLLKSVSWLAYMIFCGLCHIFLARRFKRAEPDKFSSCHWEVWFTIICVAEGTGWGCIGLATSGQEEFETLSILSAGGVAAGSIPAFSPYFPALISFVMPAIIIYASENLTSGDKFHFVSGSFMVIYVIVLIVLGDLANRAIKRGIQLRIKFEEIAIALVEQKELAENAQKAAEQASLDKSRFLAAASHDLRQPTHALNLFVGALRGVPMTEEGRDIVSHIEVLTDALDKLFAALLDISKLDAGIVEVHRHAFEINLILSRVCADFSRDASAKGLALKYVPSRAVVNSDPVLVERIARNLISNAIRYTDRGKVIVGCRYREAGIAMQVWDTGAGIAPDQQELIFQEYYQVGNPERNREKGLGLGLAIVRRLAKLLESSVTLRSVPKRGSCFELLLERADFSNFSPMSVEVNQIDVAQDSAFIVVIDDERAIRTGMSILLSSWGYEVMVAGSADEAITMLATKWQRPDLLICDFRLRGEETGVDAIYRLCTEYNDTIPAMLISGDITANFLSAEQSNELLVLHKPVSNTALKAAIVELITAGISSN